MSNIRKIARRSFLIGSAAIVGGVAFGAYAITRPAPNPLVPTDGETAFNPFVMISDTQITLIAPKAEMGQGVQTTWAALIAEELDVELDQITVLHGPAAKAYYNSAVIAEGLPDRGYDRTDRGHAIGAALGHVAKLLDLQVTGGSSSMRDGFTRMRAAGASARETLKEAAAQKWNLPRNTLSTANGQVTAPDGRSLAYTDLASAASAIEPIETELRDPKTWRLVGKDLPRLDMLGKVTGTATYGIDKRLPGMKFASVKRNPIHGAGMHGFDASVAEKMPGVEKIIDIGDGVAVVATNTWLAIQALEAIEFRWKAAPFSPENDQIFKEIEAAFDLPSNSTMRDDGDVTALPANAKVVEATYQVPYLAHAAMEPLSATALYNTDQLDIWAGNQSPTITQRYAAKAAGLEAEQVNVHTELMGGSFGRRLEYDFTEIATKVAKSMPGVPVQVTWSREEDMSHDMYRPGAIAKFRGAVSDGKATIIDGKLAGQSVMQSTLGRLGLPFAGPDKAHVDALFNAPYSVPNIRMQGHIADIAIPVGSWRSVAASNNGFFIESFIDELAHAADADPLQFRFDLAKSEWEPAANVLQRVRDMSNWDTARAQGRTLGVAMSYSFGTPVAEVIEVVDEDGSIRLKDMWIAADLGLALDRRNVEAQLFGAAIFGLSAACFGEITFAKGTSEQLNFPDYDALRMHTTPKIQVEILETQPHMGGAGEPGTPPAAPALANAIFALTGTRPRRLPLMHDFDLVI